MTTALIGRMSPGSPLSCQTRTDPLGDINKIVALVRRNPDGTQTTVRGALYPVRAGTAIRFGKGQPSLETIKRLVTDDEYQRLLDADPAWWIAPVWFIEVDGRRIVEVPEHEAWPSFPPTRAPLSRRISKRARDATDAIAKRLGYQRIGNCDCEDDRW